MCHRFSPRLVFRPSRGDQPPPAEGELLPTTLDDFNDLVLGDLITYARCEQLPQSPLSLPVYDWPSGAAYLLDQTLLQTVFGGLLSAGGGDLCRRSAYGFGRRPIVGNGTAGLSVPILGVFFATIFSRIFERLEGC